MENNLNQIFFSNNPNTLPITGGLLFEDILNLRLYEIFFIIIYLMLFIFFIKIFLKKKIINKNKIYFLILYHYIFVILSYTYSLMYVNDLDTFFQYAYLFDAPDDNVAANRVMVTFNLYLSHFLNLHYFSIFIFFGFFSSIGFILLFISFNQFLSKFKFDTNLLFGLFLIPSWHFFTSFPGKDAIILFAIGLLCFFLQKKFYFYTLIPIILIFLVRPQVSFVLFVIFLFVSVHYFLIHKIKNKTFYFIMMIIFFGIFLFFLKNFNQHYFDFLINFFETGSISRNYMNNFSGWYETNNNIFLNSLKYLLYPLMDFSNLSRAIISFENIAILFLILKTILNFKKKIFIQITHDKNIIFFLVYFIIMLILLSNFTANIGISARQKWMIMPFLFLFIVPFLSKIKFYKK